MRIYVLNKDTKNKVFHVKVQINCKFIIIVQRYVQINANVPVLFLTET